MGAIKFNVSIPLIKEVLGFPDDVDIASIELNNNLGVFEFTLIGSIFPPVEWNGYSWEAVRGNPEYKTTTQKIYEVSNWNIEKKEQERCQK